MTAESVGAVHQLLDGQVEKLVQRRRGILPGKHRQRQNH